MSDLSGAKRVCRYLGGALRRHSCRAVMIEGHYIDRDHMDDHSVYHSSALSAPPNYCQRLHFFNISEGELVTRLNQLHATPRKSRSTALSAFSDEHYIGFSVIRPLRTSPFGRTVIRPLPNPDLIVTPAPPKPVANELEGWYIQKPRKHFVHVWGLTLRVRGVAWQQQDSGVSACATMAVWMTLQQMGSQEQIGFASPAAITLEAGSSALPFGRVFPSEGLTSGQMARALSQFGLPPKWIRTSSQSRTLQLIGASLRSRIPPILLLDDEPNGRRHTVVAVGLVRGQPPSGKGRHTDFAESVAGVLVHDDRVGPDVFCAFSFPSNQARNDLADSLEYRSPPSTASDSCSANSGRDGRLGSRGLGQVPSTGLQICVDDEGVQRFLDPNGMTSSDGAVSADILKRFESWKIKALLVPLHGKIRVAFPGLLALRARLEFALDLRSDERGAKWQTSTHSGVFYVSRGHRYVAQMLDRVSDPSQVAEQTRQWILPRYLGVLTFRFGGEVQMEVLVDTTSAPYDPQISRVVLYSEDCSSALTAKVSQTVRRTESPLSNVPLDIFGCKSARD